MKQLAISEIYDSPINSFFKTLKGRLNNPITYDSAIKMKNIQIYNQLNDNTDVFK